MPVSSVCNVIEAVLEHLGNVTVDCLPDPRTVSYFAYELGIISKLQVGEILYDNDNVTLSWDSTSVEGHHINEVASIFSLIVSSFAEYHKLDPIQTKSTIIHHLKNTLTDGVAVNHCVVQSLQSSLKRGSSQEDGDDVSMTLYEFLVDYITDDLYISEIDVQHYSILLMCVQDL